MAHKNTQFVFTVLLALLAGAAAADESKLPAPDESKLPAPDEPKLPTSNEPVQCYRLVSMFDDGMLVGLAVELCSGTTNAVSTVACYVEAATSKESGGLGLNRGQAIGLCRTAGASARP